MSLEDLISNKLFLFAIVIATGLLYFPLNHRKSKYYWESKIDRKIPLIPIFIIPYIYLFFPYLVLGFFFLWKSSVATDLLKSFIIANVVADVIWYLFPNGVRRPRNEGSGFWEKMVSALYKIDKFDTNGFPSYHIYSSSIVLSTLFVKQHYVIDVVGGIVLFLFSIMCLKVSAI